MKIRIILEATLPDTGDHQINIYDHATNQLKDFIAQKVAGYRIMDIPISYTSFKSELILK